MDLSAVTKTGVDFFLKMTVDELADWIDEVNEKLREDLAALKAKKS